MTDSIKFTAEAGQKIVKAVQQVLGAPAEKTGSPSHKRSYDNSGFWAFVTDHQSNSGYEYEGTEVGQPYLYSWQECYETGTSQTLVTLGTMPKPPARWGTKDSSGGDGDLGPLINSAEYSYNSEGFGYEGQQPIPKNSYVWVEMAFDAATPPNPIFRTIWYPPELVYFVITGADAGDGQYSIIPINGLSVAASGTAFSNTIASLVQGALAEVTWLGCNLDEVALKGHRLRITEDDTGFLIGKLVAPGVVYFHGGVGSTAGATNLTTVGQSWTRNNGPSDSPPGGTPVQLSAANKYNLAFDARGMLTGATCIS